MSNRKKSNNKTAVPPLELASRQRSHILFVLSNPAAGKDNEFLDWYRHEYSKSIAKVNNVLSVQCYEQYEPNKSYPPPDYRYFGIVELSLDGAEEAEAVIQKIIDSHENESSADSPTTWLYYPICEAVGRPSTVSNPLLIVAFANGKPGDESEFREWYCTRHIRHVLHAPYNTNGQCFGLTHYQRSGTVEPLYSIISVYEQENTPQEAGDFRDSLSEEQASVLREKFAFPTIDGSRCGESYYRPITEKF